MSIQYSIDDVAWEYQTEPPIIVPVTNRILVGNDKICDSLRCVAANFYTLNVNDPTVVSIAKTFLNNRASADLLYQDNVLANKAQAGSTNTQLITIPSPTGDGHGDAAPYPSTKIISSVARKISAISVSLFGFTHTFPSDVRVGLSGPTGIKTLVMVKCGGNVVVSPAVNLTFMDSAAAPLTAGTITAGSWQCSDPFNFQAQNSPFFLNGFSNAAPTGMWTPVNLHQFIGSSPNGTWSLWVIDDSAGNVGTINGGWDIALTVA